MQTNDLKNEINMDSDDEQTDFLEVDNPLPGQQYGCVSFISPEKEIAQKNDYFSYNFYKYQMKMAKKILQYHLRNLKKSAPENVLESELQKFEEKVLTDYDKLNLTDTTNRYLYEELKEKDENASNMEEEKADYSDFKEFNEKYLEEFENFKVVHEDRMQSEYDDGVGFKTNIRGVKLRGNYETYKEAKMRAKILQRKDPSFHVWVAQVGYWVPFDADPDKAPSSEYQEAQLQELAKKKKENEEKREMLQMQRREEEKKLAAIRNKKAKAEQKKMTAEKKAINESEANINPNPDPEPEEVGEPTETLSINKVQELLAQRKQELKEGEDMAFIEKKANPNMSNEMLMKQAGFGGMDPWLARKMEDKASQEEEDDDDEEK